MNKLSLVGMQLPEKYIRRISTFRAKALRLELDEGPLLETSEFLYFSGSCIPTNESLFKYLVY